MITKPVRIRPATRDLLSKFVEHRTVKRKRGHGPMTLGEGIDLLFTSYNRDNYIKMLFELVRKLSSYLRYQEDRWDYTIHHRDTDLVDCVRYFYEFLKICPKEDSSNVRVHDFYQRLINTLENLLDEYDNPNLHD
jgi:hypothetical protein